MRIRGATRIRGARRIWGARRRGAALAAALALGLAAGLWLLWPVRAVEITNDSARQPIARVAADDAAPLRLTYLHSIYRQPAAEEFTVRDEGLELVRLASPSVAVLEYYARPEPIVPSGGAYEIQPAPTLYRQLSVLVGAVGRRTVAYAGRELPLYQLAADGDRVSLHVGWTPRLALLMQ